ncbi:hypothetical protein H311_00471, partial [Anncaliia algerae PRA109]
MILYEIYKFILTCLYMITIIYTYFTFVGIYCLDIKEFLGTQVIVYFIIYHFILGITLIVYLRLRSIEELSTIEMFPPVKTTREYNLDLSEINPMFAMEIREIRNKKLQVCDICQRFKPPRCHHCSICNKCFLKYDHHCYLFGMCIFYQKYKFFYQFMLYNLILSLFVSTIFIKEIITGPKRNLTQLNFIINLTILILMIVYNTYMLILNNETTIEYYALNSYILGDNTHNKVFQEGP